MVSGRPSERMIYFNPRPPRGGRPQAGRAGGQGGHFNPRPPRGGRLVAAAEFLQEKAGQFQSTPPARGATRSCRPQPPPTLSISIHAPREGGDVWRAIRSHPLSYFNPRPPRGGRHAFLKKRAAEDPFQSTPPARGATFRGIERHENRGDFNPRPPRGGRPRGLRHARALAGNFNPRPPRGGRRTTPPSLRGWRVFQSTPPARGATAKMHSFTCESLTNK